MKSQLVSPAWNKDGLLELDFKGWRSGWKALYHDMYRGKNLATTVINCWAPVMITGLPAAMLCNHSLIHLCQVGQRLPESQQGPWAPSSLLGGAGGSRPAGCGHSSPRGSSGAGRRRKPSPPCSLPGWKKKHCADDREGENGAIAGKRVEEA